MQRDDRQGMVCDLRWDGARRDDGVFVLALTC